MPRLLITGADGFTGVHLSALARALGYEVFPLVSNLRDKEGVIKEIASVQPVYVCHLAAISAVTHSCEEEFYKVNLFGTTNLLNALALLPVLPKMVLIASSANVYGNAANGRISESVCPKPVNHYATSKLAMEHMAATYINTLPLIITRPFNYTGHGQDTRFVIPKIIDLVKRGETSIDLGNLDVYREYNDVRMICEVYLKLLGMGVPGRIYNVCSGRSYSLRAVIAEVELLIGRTLNITINPDLYRPNEVNCLEGDPSRCKFEIGSYRTYELRDTLAWMIETS